MDLTYDGDIFDAVEFGDLDTLKLYWQDAIDLDYQEKEGNTLLMLAVSYGWEEIVQFLLSKGPNLHLINKEGDTALDIARKKRHMQIAEWIQKAY